jgi:hypothetical protein
MIFNSFVINLKKQIFDRKKMFELIFLLEFVFEEHQVDKEEHVRKRD